MKSGRPNPFTNQQSAQAAKQKKAKKKFLECGDIYLLRPDSKKKALTVLQSKLHSERKNLDRVALKEYDSDLGRSSAIIKDAFNKLEKRYQTRGQVRRVIGKKKMKEGQRRKVRLGLFAKMLEKIKKDMPKVRDIGMPKLEAISSK